jgi:putative glutamine amidotransferase
MKPYIGITCGVFRDRDWCPPIHGHRQTYVDSVVNAGGAPFQIPRVVDEEVLRALYDRLDGVVLSGGGDMDPSSYGEEPIPQVSGVDTLRDQMELQLTRWALADGKPLLGLCRGLHVINVALGGTLYQDIPAQLSSELVHDSSFTRQDWTYMAHEITLEPNSRLAQIFGTAIFDINSLHHQAVKQIAPGLRAVGWAQDGVVEAIEGDFDNFVIAVQCHPEALQGDADPRWRTLFKRFIDCCRETAPLVGLGRT